MALTGTLVALERITPELARRIIAREERSGDNWHSAYPLVDQLDPLRSLTPTNTSARQLRDGGPGNTPVSPARQRRRPSVTTPRFGRRVVQATSDLCANGYLVRLRFSTANGPSVAEPTSVKGRCSTICCHYPSLAQGMP